MAHATHTLLILLVILRTHLAAIQFRVTHEWKYLNFTWPSAETLQLALANGFYIPNNVVISSVDYHDGWYYIGLPRMKLGAPATLARIPAAPTDPSPPLQPFPSWALNQISNCSALQNVQNVEIDPRHRIWILDGGHVNTLGNNPIKMCPPKFLIYDISANETVQVHEFPEDVAGKDSFLYDLVLDDDDYAYITDNSALDPGIIVYHLRSDRSWKLRDARTMRADPAQQQLRINHVLIDAPINIAGIALGPRANTSSGPSSGRLVYYSPISSRHLYAISAYSLRHPASDDIIYVNHIRDVGVKQSQTDGMLMDNRGVLYYGLLGENGIGRWDSRMPFSAQKTIARDANYIQWTNSFTLDDAGNLIVLTDRLQTFITGQLDLGEANFWLLSAQVNGRGYMHGAEEVGGRGGMGRRPPTVASPPTVSTTMTTTTEEEAEETTTTTVLFVTEMSRMTERYPTSDLQRDDVGSNVTDAESARSTTAMPDATGAAYGSAYCTLHVGLAAMFMHYTTKFY